MTRSSAIRFPRSIFPPFIADEMARVAIEGRDVPTPEDRAAAWYAMKRRLDNEDF